MASLEAVMSVDLYYPTMATWADFEAEQPHLAQRVKASFAECKHKTIATLRRDGAPRISGIECEFTDGQLQFGSMTGARKGADLRRDPRFALHGPTNHPGEGHENEWRGEAKLAGRAIYAGNIPDDGGGPGGEMFVADISEVTFTGLNEDATALIIESWVEGRGYRRIQR